MTDDKANIQPSIGGLKWKSGNRDANGDLRHSETSTTPKPSLRRRSESAAKRMLEEPCLLELRLAGCTTALVSPAK